MKLDEAVTRTIAENRMMSPGYIAARVMETVKRFLDHNMAEKDPTRRAEMLEMIEEDHMP